MTEQSEANRNTALNRIRALLAKTTANGATEAEAMSAMAMAQALMAKYELDEADLAIKEHRKPEVSVNKTTVMYDQEPYWFKQAGYALQTFARVRIIGGKTPDGGIRITHVGDSVDRSLSVYLSNVFEQACEWEFDAHKADVRSRGHQLGTGAKNSFVVGMLGRIRERMLEMIRERDASTSRALVVIDTKRNAIAQFVRVEFPNLRHGRSRAVTVRNADAYLAGQKAGNRVGLNRPVEGGDSRNGRLN